jgi:hypothetical protein
LNNRLPDYQIRSPPFDTVTMNIVACRGLMAALVVVVCASPAAAQMWELVGTRAQGMGGAFVAVADDATATWWNPAGLATGATLSFVWDMADNLAPSGPRPEGPASLGDTMGFALATPALGLSYYRLRISEMQPVSSNGAGTSVRQEEGATGIGLRTLALNQFGATFGQSLGGNVVMASTLKLIRAGTAVSVGPVPGKARDALEHVGELELSMETQAALDVGAMVMLSRQMRVGISVKHLREPEFGEGETGIQLERQARVGVAVMGGGQSASLTTAADFDITTLDTVLGDVRHIGAGGEAWLLNRLVGLRGGFSTNTAGEGGTSWSVGASAGARGVFVDGFMTLGSDATRDGWGISARLGF